MAPASTYKGPVKLEFRKGDWRKYETVATLTDTRIGHDWRGEAPAPGVDPKGYRARWTGTIEAPSTGSFIFLVQNHGNISVSVDGKEIVGSWANPGETLYAEAPLVAGKSYAVEVAAIYDDVGSPAVRFAWGPVPPLLTPAEEARIKAADAVVVSAGFNLSLEGEGADRAYALPAHQPELIRRAAELNPRTVVVLNSGGVVATAGWLDRVPAFVQAWYPGQEGGRAVADVLLGAWNPGGKLPLSYEKRAEDSPSFGHYPGSGGKVDYAEGLFVGYRWFDSKGVAPLFPFGFGLSYTSFAYSDLTVEPRDNGSFAVRFSVTNNGTRTGDEVSELYVSPPVSSAVVRPVRELKGFSREHLDTDQSANITVILDRSAFAHFDEAKHDWVVEPGSYTVTVGSSSRNLLLARAVDVP
jgi:beta-glucosidase